MSTDRHEYMPPVIEERSPSGKRTYIARCSCGFKCYTGTDARIAAGVARTHATKKNRADALRKVGL